MIAQCWVHIGTEKTGTTSIQEYLASNRNKLLVQGYLYPVAPGKTNHLGLTCYALDDRTFEMTRRTCGVTKPADVAGFRLRLLTELEKEIGQSTASMVIFSNEHLSSRLRTNAEIRRLKSLCERIARTTKVIVYLRNQVDFLVSRYIESVKGGGTQPFPFPSGSASKQMDYARLLAPWRDIFGMEHLIVRRFEPEAFHGGELVSDFGAQIGFDALTFVPATRRNEAPDAQCVAFLREFNKHIPHLTGGRRNPLRGRIVNYLEQISSVDKFAVARDIADAIEERFQDSNKKVSTEYFNSPHIPLFRDPRSVSSAPRDTTVREDAATTVRIAARLWAEQQREINILSRRTPSNMQNMHKGATAVTCKDDRKQGRQPLRARLRRWLKLSVGMMLLRSKPDRSRNRNNP